MAHHGNEQDPVIQAAINKQMHDLQKKGELGPTGRFPLGKLRPQDEGEIRVGITTLDGKIVMDFGGKVTWIGFTPDQAVWIATTLLVRADEARKENRQ